MYFMVVNNRLISRYILLLYNIPFSQFFSRSRSLSEFFKIIENLQNKVRYVY